MDRIDTTAAGPDAAAAPLPPEGRHRSRDGTRAFLTEIAIVVIGVLLALGAEQIVQWWNWQDEVKESREAIDAEISYNLGSRKLRQEQSTCFESRLDDLQRWHDSWIAGRPLKPSAPISRFNERTILFDAWNVAQAGQVAAHIPLDDRIRYAKLYGFFRTFSERQDKEVEYWDALQKFDGAQSLTDRDLMELQGLVTNLRRLNAFRKLNWPLFVAASRDFGIPFGSTDNIQVSKGLCQPLFAETRG